MGTLLWPDHVSRWVVGETLYIAAPIAALRATDLHEFLKALGIDPPKQVLEEREPPDHS